MRIFEVLKNKSGKSHTAKRWDLPLSEISKYNLTDFLEYVNVLKEKSVRLNTGVVQHTPVLLFCYLLSIDDLKEMENYASEELAETWNIVTETLEFVANSKKIKYISFNNLMKLLREMSSNDPGAESAEDVAV